MSLAPGFRIASYEILAPIGAGGMGEVYRARDTRLKREVALKVLPADVADDRERLARFQREAEVLATLNHPNIAHIHGIEESNGTIALVMELVEGEDLAQRIARGAIPMSEALPIAKQIAEAFEAAHEQGIVHRDLKPANIKVREDGTVKVLDFGLAKAFQDPKALNPKDLSASPTITSPAMTMHGVILGTAAYMSPEQAKGRTVDRRADIWAFGAVLFEMLTARRLYEAEGVAETLARVIERDPDLSGLPATTPSFVRVLLSRCLTKDPRARLQSIGEARVALSGGWDQTVAAPPVAASPHGAAKAPKIPRLTAVAAALAAGLALGVALARVVRTPPADAPVDGLPVVFDVPSAVPDQFIFATSPDGRHLAYPDVSDGVRKLVIRTLDEPAPRVVPGSEGVVGVFWSPDSSSVGFYVPNEIRRAALAGGPARRIAATGASSVFLGGSWSTRDEIAFAINDGQGIWKVGAGGGAPENFIPRDQTTPGSAAFPVWLGDGHRLLYLHVRADDPSKSVISLRDPGRPDVPVAPAHSRFALAGRHLLWLQDTSLMALPFDERSGSPGGTAFTVMEGVGGAQSALSGRPIHASDRLLAVQRGNGQINTRLMWFDRGGAQTAAAEPRANYLNIFFAASRSLVAFNAAGDIWLADLRRGTHARVTFDSGTESDPVLSPDGSVVAFYSSREPAGVYRRSVGGADRGAPLAPLGLNAYPIDWSPDGKTILVGKQGDVLAVPVDQPDRATPYLAEPEPEGAAKFSPDGRRVAYASTTGSRSEVFVQDFPASGAKWQISTSGGQYPRWHPNGRELFYLGPDSRMMAVAIEREGDGLRFGAPTPLFEVPNSGLSSSGRKYAVAPDGRFLINLPVTDAAAPVTVYVNWQQSLLARPGR